MLAMMIDSGRGDNGDYDWAINDIDIGTEVKLGCVGFGSFMCSKRVRWAVRPVGWVGVVELGQLNVG